MPEYQWDNRELPGGYDHDADTRRHKRLRMQEQAPAEAPANLPVLGKCVLCHRPGLHTWPKDGTIICAKHWTRLLARRAEDLVQHPEAYVDEEAAGKVRPRRRTNTVPKARRTKTETGYGVKGDDNWRRRNERG